MDIISYHLLPNSSALKMYNLKKIETSLYVFTQSFRFGQNETLGNFKVKIEAHI